MSEPQNSPSPLRIDWFLVSLAYLGLFVYGFIDNARGPIFPDLLKEFRLSDSAGATFFVASSTMALVNNLVLFRWMEKIGAFRCVQLYSVLQAVGLVLIGVAHDFPIVLLGSAFLGAAFGGNGVAVNLLTAQGTPSRLRRQVLSGLHCTYGASSLLAPLLVTLLYHFGLNWKLTLAVMSLGPAAVLVMSMWSDRSGAREFVVPPKALPRSRTRRPWNAVIFYSVICTCYVIAEISIGTRLALLARREWNYDVDQANLLLSGFYVGLFLGRFVFALRPMPWAHRHVLIGCASVGLIASTLGLLTSPWWLAFAGFGFSVFYPSMIDAIHDDWGDHAGFVTSWSITIQSLGLMLMHFTLGWLSDIFGLRHALVMAPLSLLVVLLFLWQQPRFQSGSVRARSS